MEHCIDIISSILFHKVTLKLNIDFFIAVVITFGNN